jgi:hypothetical protein
MTGMGEQPPQPEADLSTSLGRLFPTIPMQSVVRCVLDAQSAVDYAGVAREDRDGLVERLARAHLEELAPFYVDAE